MDQTAVPFLTSSLSFKPPQDANTSTMKGKTGKNNLADDVIMNSRNLSSTLEKLYLLEEKLYKEIKVHWKSFLLEKISHGKSRLAQLNRVIEFCIKQSFI